MQPNDDPGRPRHVAYNQTSLYGNGIPFSYMMPPPAVLAEPLPADQADRDERLAKVYLLSRFIRIFACIDSIFLFFLGAMNVYYFFGFLGSLCGYFGAKAYNRWLCLFYLFYVLANASFRMYLMIMVYEVVPLFILSGVLSVAVSLYIAYLLVSFFIALAHLNQEDRVALAFIENPPVLYTRFLSPGQNQQYYQYQPTPPAPPQPAPSAPAPPDVEAPRSDFSGTPHHMGDPSAPPPA